MLSEGEILKLLGFDPEQHFTQPPPRFSQATLIKELEEKGIGRPSTYVAIMNILRGLRRGRREQAAASDLARTRRQRPAGHGVPRYSRSRLHREARGRTRRRRRRPRRMGSDAASILEAVREAPRRREKQDARGQAHGREDRSQLRARRRRDGHQMGPQRRVPRVLELSQMPQHQGVQARRSGRHPDRSRRRDDDRCRLRQMRQADGRKRSRFGEFLGCSGYPDCDGIKKLQGRPGPHRRQLPRMQRGRDARAAHAPRQDLLGMRPLSEVQVRELGQSHPAAVPDLRRALPGGERLQAHRHHLAMRQQGMRLQSARARRCATEPAPASTPPA